MVQVLDAIFDGVVLRPEEPVELAPNTRVRIIIETIESAETETPSFLQTARSLNLEGPSDWSEKIEDYLYGDKLESDATTS